MLGGRFLLIYGGERSGKSQTAAAIGALDMLPTEDGKPRRYWIVGPDYREAQPEFLYIYNAFNSLGMVESVSMPQDERSPWKMMLKHGVDIQTRTGYNFSKLASFSIHGAIIAEAGKQDLGVLQKLRGRVSETKGWIVLVGTPEDELPWYNELFQQWKAPNPQNGQSFSLPTYSNTAVYPGGKEDPEYMSLMATPGMSEEEFNERYGGVVSKSSRRVIPDFDFETHVRELEIVDAPVELAIDPGSRHYAVAFVQQVGLSTLYVHDCIYATDTVAQDVIAECMAHPLWEHLDFSSPVQGCIDIAARQHQGHESQLELWRTLAGVQLESKYRFIGNTLRTVRYRLANRLVFFSSNMRTGSAADGMATEALSEFDLWRWPKSRPGLINEQDVPPDKNNHFIKAIGYYMGWKYGDGDTVGKKRGKKSKSPKSLNEYGAAKRRK